MYNGVHHCIIVITSVHCNGSPCVQYRIRAFVEDEEVRGPGQENSKERTSSIRLQQKYMDENNRQSFSFDPHQACMRACVHAYDEAQVLRRCD